METTLSAWIDWSLANWDLLSIPVASAFIGWFTNWLAIRMMFYPVEFVGIKPWLGWQGIVPQYAEGFAKRVVRLISKKLLNIEDMYAGFTGEKFIQHAQASVDHMTDMAVREISRRYAPKMWEALNDETRTQIRAAIRVEVEAAAVRIVEDMARDATSIVDTEHTVLGAIRGDRGLLSRIFMTVGRKEFRFIQQSGIYFGFLFGIPMMFVWATFPSAWLLPVSGFAVGYATNWLALKMIFEPAQPKQIGPFVVQGMFHKRQREVAEEFAGVVADHVFTGENVLLAITTGKGFDTVSEIVTRNLSDAVAKHTQNPMVASAMKAAGVEADALQAELRRRVVEELPKPGGLLHIFAAKSVDVRDQLFSRLSVLDAESFEGVLRPAFQKDEWKLIIAGGALGALAGWAQAVWVFGERLAGLALQAL